MNYLLVDASRLFGCWRVEGLGDVQSLSYRQGPCSMNLDSLRSATWGKTASIALLGSDAASPEVFFQHALKTIFG
jgi:hypothetical protein